MSVQHDIVTRHMSEILADAEAAKVPADLIGRELINQVIDIYRQTRSIDDIASELSFLAENLDPDQEYAFMRP